MTTPGTDTTDDGQGGTGPGASAPATNTDTSPGGGSRTDPRSPDHVPFDSQTGYGDADGYRTGDVDNSPPVTQIGDTTNGGIGHTVNQPYRPPAGDIPGENVDTTGRGGFVRVSADSPDADLVGNDSGINPNAAEPGFTNATNTASHLDTGGYGSPPITTVPGGTGVPAAPTNVVATALPKRRAVDIHWDAPANAVAAGVTGYTIESNTHGTQNVGKNSTYVEFEEGLEGGRAYTFTVYAFGPNGSGYRSAASNTVTIPTGDLVADDSRAEGL